MDAKHPEVEASCVILRCTILQTCREIQKSSQYEDRYRVTFYDTLNGLRQTEKVDVYVTGSNSKTLSKDIETNFADRGTQIRVRPFSFAEYCDAAKPVDKGEALSKCLIWGGMPLAVLESDDRCRARYLKSVVPCAKHTAPRRSTVTR